MVQCIERPANHPNIVSSCNAVGPFDAITAKGINCGAVTTMLSSNTEELEALERGATVRIAEYSCPRIDRGSQAETVQCTSTGGTSHRASVFTTPPEPGPVIPQATTSSAPPSDPTPDDDSGDTDAGTG